MENNITAPEKENSEHLTLFKSLGKHLDTGSLTIQDEGDVETDNNSGHLVLYIAIPVAALIVILLLAATAATRYKKFNIARIHQKNNTNSINNNNHIESGEELQPLKRNSRLEHIETSQTGMQIITDVSPQKIKRLSNERNSLNSIEENWKKKSASKESSNKRIGSECAIVSVETNNHQRHSSTDSALSSLKSFPSRHKSTSSLNDKEVSLPGCVGVTKQEIHQNIKPTTLIPLERPNTLSVMTVIGDHGSSRSNTPTPKGFPWTEQLWTPDADVIHETISPCVENTTERELTDKITPLMARNKFRMKPKGLLERRGSNVALTISLSAEEKDKPAITPSTIKSPKPLVYLRTATNLLDPVQLHVKATDKQRLQREYWEIPMNHPSEKHFSIPGYGTKNRYRSILPNPHSRVLLPSTPSGDPLSMYINANYIRGYNAIKLSNERRKTSESDKENTMKRRMSAKRKAAFIATQGPMTNTIGDFWKMVWRERSNTIIMITKLKEQKEKCSEYIPSEIGQSSTYEEFVVTVNHIRHANHYDVRTVEVQNTCTNQSRIVNHFWYPEWLDHETPERTRSVLELIQEVSVLCPDDNETSEFGPVVVHCSAGIGRTGCFIAIAIGSMMLQEEGKVDILKIVCHMRMDRGGMIQTWEQYQYVHLALSRFARVLAGENVTTPSTAGSVKSPPTTQESLLHVCTSKSCEEADNAADKPSVTFPQKLFNGRGNTTCSPINEITLPDYSSTRLNEDDLSGSYSPGKRVKTNETIFFNNKSDSISNEEQTSNFKVPKTKNIQTCIPDVDKEKNAVTVNLKLNNCGKLKITKSDPSPKMPISSPPLRDSTNSESPAVKSPKSAQLPHVFTFPSPSKH